ncbi:hypothetical protein LF1_41520 [Rubripirellula obstinata]|uniref:Uncharacterized protein n=1 Tax=Rubripirellula obstinata TaxID=406547 RepID=A0A5B1CMS3_9BACT|nr:hypothetical protein LF1_41520 [Rubripirellula obstinata]
MLSRHQPATLRNSDGVLDRIADRYGEPIDWEQPKAPEICDSGQRASCVTSSPETKTGDPM